MAKVEALTQRIQSVLRDANNDSWADETIWQTINEAEKVIVSLRPDAAPVDLEYTCTQGIKQDLSALTPKAHRLMRVKFNRNGGVNGRAVRRVAIGDKDTINPLWMTAAESDTIREFMHDEREPLVFYVSPPASVNAKLQISYARVPAEYPPVVISTTETTISDIYEPHIIEFSLYRLFGHDVENSVNISRSQQHLATFNSMMGVKYQSDMASSAKNIENRR